MEADKRESRRQDKLQHGDGGPSLVGTGMKKRGKMAGRSKHGRDTNSADAGGRGGGRGRSAGGRGGKRMSQGASLRRGKAGGGAKRRGGKS